jgi:hypothetical protein
MPPSRFLGRFKRLEKPRWVSRLVATPATLRPFQRSLQQTIVFSHRPSDDIPREPKYPPDIFWIPA